MATSKKQNLNDPSASRPASDFGTPPDTNRTTSEFGSTTSNIGSRENRSMTSTGGTATGAATARSFYDQAKETAGQAYEAAAEKATTKLEEQKTNLSGGLASIAGSVRQVGENLRGPDVQDGISKFTSEYSGLAADKIEGIASYFERKNVREMYADLESFARRNPAMFVGGAFAIGLLAGRFLKSGSPSSGTRFAERDTPGATFDTGTDISPV